MSLKDKRNTKAMIDGGGPGGVFWASTFGPDQQYHSQACHRASFFVTSEKNYVCCGIRYVDTVYICVHGPRSTNQWTKPSLVYCRMLA